ncbi:MAG: LysR family transcriptional regulator [Alphaproteobacteria bacterium]|nr:LysR family transcriptional regulator [Alphaproteobacteria bacterium]
MNWDDLRIARAVYQTGSFAAAAARLRINETTVARRLARLQEDLGVTLFEAVDGVRRPTAHCKEVVALAETMASQAERIARIGALDEGPVGRRRVATTDSVATEVLAPRAAAFLAENPGISLDFLASTENVNFSRWEADLAIRLGKPDRGDFVISKLADLSLYLFAPAKAASDGRELVCAYPDELDATPESQYLMGLGLHQRARCTTKNLLVVKRLIRSKQCSGILPSFMCGDLIGDKSLKATKLPEPRGVWLLIQPHLKDDPATRAVIAWIRDCFASLEISSEMTGSERRPTAERS